MTLKSDAKFKGKLTYAFKNDKEFGKFVQAEIMNSTFNKIVVLKV